MKKRHILQDLITVLFLGALSFVWAYYFAHHHTNVPICRSGVGGFGSITITESQTGLTGTCPAHMKHDVHTGLYASHIVACYDHDRSQTYLCNVAYADAEIQCPLTYPAYDIQILTTSKILRKNLTRESVGCFVLWFKTP